MGRLIAIGDIHGCSQTLEAMLQRLALDRTDTLIVTGDLSAKGIDSKGVHEKMLGLQERGVDLILLIGNHELMLLALQRFIGASIRLPDVPEELLHEGEITFLMRSNGGWATLKSYDFDGVDDRNIWAFDCDDPREHFLRVAETIRQLDWILPGPHLELLSKCKTYHIDRNCLFVHAGLSPGFLRFSTAKEAVDAQLRSDARELCWARDWLGTRPAFPELLVHGHTPLSCLFSFIESTDPWRDQELVFKSVPHAGALNLDSGAFTESGHLTAVEIPEDGDPAKIKFIRVARIDPVERDRLWYVNLTS